MQQRRTLSKRSHTDGNVVNFDLELRLTAVSANSSHLLQLIDILRRIVAHVVGSLRQQNVLLANAFAVYGGQRLGHFASEFVRSDDFGVRLYQEVVVPRYSKVEQVHCLNSLPALAKMRIAFIRLHFEPPVLARRASVGMAMAAAQVARSGSNRCGPCVPQFG